MARNTLEDIVTRKASFPSWRLSIFMTCPSPKRRRGGEVCPRSAVREQEAAGYMVLVVKIASVSGYS